MYSDENISKEKWMFDQSNTISVIYKHFLTDKKYIDVMTVSCWKVFKSYETVVWLYTFKKTSIKETSRKCDQALMYKWQNFDFIQIYMRNFVKPWAKSILCWYARGVPR